MNKLFVLVRADLAPSYQAVQAGHAVAAWILDKAPGSWENEILVYLHVRREQDLLDLADRLTWEGRAWVLFREPDLGGQATALAVLGGDKLLARYPLLELGA